MNLSDAIKKRNANMDLLRMLSMMMVTMLHALGKSSLLLPMSGEMPLNGWLAWVLECFSVGAVNIFMLLSGYFLVKSKFQVSRLLEIMAQAFFYTFGTFLVYILLGKISAGQTDVYQLLQYYLPVHMDVYWFITVYVALYMFQPILSNGVQNVSQKTLKTIIICLLIYECLVKTVLPFRLGEDRRGYSLLWYLILFLVGAYFRLYGFSFLKKAWHGWLLFLFGTEGVFAEIFLIYQINARTGRLSELVQISLDYNHLFAFLAAVGIFQAFLLGKELPKWAAKVVYVLSPMALGVYLFQENMILRYEWQKWFGLPGSLQKNTALFLGTVFGAVIGMYVIGTIVDYFRILLFRGVVFVFRHGTHALGKGDQ